MDFEQKERIADAHKILNNWYASLTTENKARIIRNYITEECESADVEKAEYPNCSSIWNELDLKTKVDIYHSNSKKQALFLPALQDYKTNK